MMMMLMMMMMMTTTATRPYLGGNRLRGTVAEQVLDHMFLVFLGCHVQRGEAVL